MVALECHMLTPTRTTPPPHMQCIDTASCMPANQSARPDLTCPARPHTVNPHGPKHIAPPRRGPHQLSRQDTLRVPIPLCVQVACVGTHSVGSWRCPSLSLTPPLCPHLLPRLGWILSPACAAPLSSAGHSGLRGPLRGRRGPFQVKACCRGNPTTE